MTQTVRAILALVLREMSTTFGRSPGGYAWAVLEPVAGIALLTVVLSLAFHAPPLGDSFALFYASGLVPFLFYNEVSTKVSQSINFSKPLLAYPGVTFLDALIARFALNYLVQLAIAYSLFFGILFAGVPGAWPNLAGLGLAFAMVGSLGLGVGTLNCFLLTRFPVWQRVWSILNRPLFIISCIFFTFDSIPERFQSFLWWNPVVHLVGQTRTAFFTTYEGTYVSPSYIFLLSLALMAFGLLFLRRGHRDLIEA